MSVKFITLLKVSAAPRGQNLGSRTFSEERGAGVLHDGGHSSLLDTARQRLARFVKFSRLMKNVFTFSYIH